MKGNHFQMTAKEPTRDQSQIHLRQSFEALQAEIARLSAVVADLRPFVEEAETFDYSPESLADTASLEARINAAQDLTRRVYAAAEALVPLQSGQHYPSIARSMMGCFNRLQTPYRQAADKAEAAALAKARTEGRAKAYREAEAAQAARLAALRRGENPPPLSAKIADILAGKETPAPAEETGLGRQIRHHAAVDAARAEAEKNPPSPKPPSAPPQIFAIGPEGAQDMARGPVLVSDTTGAAIPTEATL